MVFEGQVSAHSTLSLSVTIPDDIGSPSRLSREAIVNSIALTPLPETLVALENSKKKRKCVQNLHGKFWLPAKWQTVCSRSKRRGMLRGNKNQLRGKFIFKTKTACTICNRLWRNFKGKKNECWVQFDICDQYCCCKCIPAFSCFYS